MGGKAKTLTVDGTLASSPSGRSPFSNLQR